MKKLLLLIAFCYSLTLFAQKLEILVKEAPPYKLHQDINIEIYLINNTADSITYFDSRGPSWDSFKEVWDMNVNNIYAEILSLNSAHDRNFSDSSIIMLNPGNKNLIRTKLVNLKSAGSYSLTYTQEQGSEIVKKEYADRSVSDSALKKITAFRISENIKFEVFKNYDTTISEIINMSWNKWKDYRHVQLYSREKHFDNMYAAVRYPQDVYALTLVCDGLDEEMIKRIGEFKNLRSLILRNYELDFFPKELVELNLYELTIESKNESPISYAKGLSKNHTIRELTAKFYDGIPKQVFVLEHLMYLNISDCPIKILPKLDSLQNLEVLVANNIEISTLDNVGFNKLLKLKDLNLSGNKQIDDLRPILNCANLEFLVINRTGIQTIPHEIEKLNKLKKLSISNGLTSVSDSIGKLDDMRYLSFGGNRKLAQLPQSITNMKKLLHLDISNTKIDHLPEGIAELPLEKVLIYNTNCKISKDYKVLKKRLENKFID